MRQNRHLRIMQTIVSLILFLVVLIPQSSADEAETTTSDEREDIYHVTPSDFRSIEYGVDVSFPMHHETVSTNFPWLPHHHNNDHTNSTINVEINDEGTATVTSDSSVDGGEGNNVDVNYTDMVIQPLGDRQKLYDDYLQGCIDAFPKHEKRCKINEKSRIDMCLRQPQSMKNYTKIGFAKVKAPPAIFRLIRQFWKRNRHLSSTENWGAAYTYTNNWSVPSDMVSVENSTLVGSGRLLKRRIWNSVRKVLQDWSGQRLKESSLYGIRVYHENSILATHVDRLPLVTSAIINVDQDLDEPWPLEVYGHDGKATNITMDPGDMVLYESHSVLHGRPFPLKGRFMANLFIHFEPIGPLNDNDADQDKKDLSSYIIPGSPEEKHQKLREPPTKSKKRQNTQTSLSSGGSGGSNPSGSTVAHRAAQKGDIDTLKNQVEQMKELVNVKDKNGWTPLHEAARGGHVEIVRYLIENGANVHIQSKDSKRGEGTPLYWAKQSLNKNHPVVRLLEQHSSDSTSDENSDGTKRTDSNSGRDEL